MSPNYILLAVPFFFLLMGVEWYLGRRKNQEFYRLNDSINNLVIGIGSQVFNMAFKVLLLGMYALLYNHIAIFKIPATWWSFLLALVLFDFLFYWAHRWGHEMNIFWGAHSVHHQSEEYNLSVALRQSWFHNLIAFPIFLPIPFLGFDPVTFGAAAAVQTLYQFWVHTKVVDKMHPWFEYWFNTPSHHRVHHAVNPKYLDKNHAGMFMIWDRMFGTFKAEDENEIYYGITTQLKSWNPAWANLHYYVEMIQNAKRMVWTDKLRLIFAKPGWLPDYLGGQQLPQEVDKRSYRKYDADTTNMMKIYAALQFVVLLWCTVQYLAYYSEISTFYKVVFFVLILLTMLISGAIFEQKKWIMYAEYARLPIALLALNSFYYYWYNSWLAVMAGVSVAIFIGCLVFYSISLLNVTKQLTSTHPSDSN